MGLNSNVTNRINAPEPLQLVPVYKVADMTPIVAGTNYELRDKITVANTEELVMPASGNVTITTTNLQDNYIEYSGSGTLIQGTGSAVNLRIDCRLVDIGTGTLWGLDTTGFILGNSGGNLNWNSLGTITNSISVAFNFMAFSGFGAGLSLVGVDGFFMSQSSLRTFSDIADTYITFDADITKINCTNNAFFVRSGERAFDIDNTADVVAFINNITGVDAGLMFADNSKTQQDVGVLATSNPPLQDSTLSAELSLAGNTATTSIPAAGAIVCINNNVNWTSEELERVEAETDGSIKSISLATIKVKQDCHINLEPGNSTKTLSARAVLLVPPPITVTFDNTTNIVSETSHGRTNGDTISFKLSGSTMPTGLRKDITYFVVNANVDDFQLSYTSGGSAVAFTDNGTGTHEYKVAEIHGNRPSEPISANLPRDIMLTSLMPLVTDGVAFLAVVNEDDATDIEVNSGYQRFVL